MPVIIDPRRHDAVLFPLHAVVRDTAAVTLVAQLQAVGVGAAVFAAGRSCAEVLGAAGLAEVFAVAVDGPPGAPDPATLVQTANRLDVRPGRAVVIADSPDGVAAGRAGGFALVVGVDPAGADAAGARLLRGGADAVVTDLSEVAVRSGDRRMSALPDALQAISAADGLLGERRPAVFFDFDGTLSDIVDDPGAAVLTPGAGAALRLLATVCPVAVLSGRNLADVRERIGLPGLWYAGSHGFELTGPDGTHHQNDAAAAAIPVLATAAAGLRDQLASIAGVVVEHKRFAVAVHYRNAVRDRVGEVAAAVRNVGQRHALRVTTGREVIELRPDIDWDKGKTLHWVAEAMTAQAGAPGELTPIFLGDDITDEDAFDAVARDGIGIVVRHNEDGDRATAARFALESPDQVREFTEQLARRIGATG